MMRQTQRPRPRRLGPSRLAGALFLVLSMVILQLGIGAGPGHSAPRGMGLPVADAAAMLAPAALPDDTLVKGNASARVYAIYHGSAHWIVTRAALDLLGFANSPIAVLPQAAVNALPKGGNFVERVFANGLPNPYGPIATVFATIYTTPSNNVGVPIAVHGSGFAPGEQVQLNFANGALALQVPANAAGAIATSFVLPSSRPPGIYRLTAYGLASAHLAIEPVGISPPGARASLAVSSTSVLPGGAFTVSGGGFAPGETVYAYAYGSAGAFATTGPVNAAGAYGPITLRIPANSPVGSTENVAVFGATSHYLVAGSVVVAMAPTPVPAPTHTPVPTPTPVPTHTPVPTPVVAPVLADDTLVKGNASARVYAIYHGSAHWIVTRAALDLLGFANSPIAVLPQAAVNALPKGGDFVERILANGLPNPYGPIATVFATIYTTPSNTAGVPIAVHGSGFAPGEQVQLNVANSALVLQVPANAAGAIATSFVLPSSRPPGIYRLTAYGLASAHLAIEPVGISPPGARTSLALSPTYATPGGAFTVSGAGVVPGEAVYAYGYGATGAFAASGAVGAAGAYGPITLQLPPNAPIGSTQTVAVFGASGHYLATGVVVVAPPLPSSLQATSQTTNAGGIVTVSGSGFVPGEAIAFTANGQPAGAATAGPTGAFSGATVTIPSSVGPGLLSVVARGSTSGRAASTTLTVAALAPHLLASPTSGAPGAPIRVAGTGYAPGEPIAISFGGTTIATTPAAVVSDAQGNFFASFAIPATAVSGSNTVTATGTRSRAASSVAVSVQLPVATTWYFAGLDTGAGTDSAVAVLNPDNNPARLNLHVTFLNGGAQDHSVTVRGHGRTTLLMRRYTSGRGGLCFLRLTSDRRVGAAETTFRGGRDWASTLGVSAPARTWYLAAGDTAGSYRENLRIYNPHSFRVSVSIRLTPSRGRARTVRLALDADRGAEVLVNRHVPGGGVSATIIGGASIVVERFMTFGRGAFGASAGAGGATASATWYFPEGSTRHGFNTTFAVYNPGGNLAAVTATFFDARGRVIGARTILVAPRRRGVLVANGAVHSSGMATVLTSNVAVVVERTLSFGRRGSGGSTVSGYNGGGLAWEFPEGNTGSGNREYLLLQSTSGRTATVGIEFYTTAGTATHSDVSIPAHGRLSLAVNGVARLPAGEHGAVLISTNGVPFVAEQSIYSGDGARGDTLAGLAQ